MSVKDDYYSKRDEVIDWLREDRRRMEEETALRLARPRSLKTRVIDTLIDTFNRVVTACDVDTDNKAFALGCLVIVVVAGLLVLLVRHVIAKGWL